MAYWEGGRKTCGFTGDNFLSKLKQESQTKRERESHDIRDEKTAHGHDIGRTPAICCLVSSIVRKSGLVSTATESG